MSLTLRFLGGAGTVTGSKYLLDNGHYRVMVDCGLFQGVKELRLRNRTPLAIDPKSIDAAVLTHAHLDHTGYLPLLVKQGFNRAIFATPPTRDLAKLILLDSAHLQEEDAELANKRGYSKHHPAEPLYTESDVHKTLRLFMPVQDGAWTEILPGWKLRLQKSGHILGSVFVELEAEGKRIVFSGDLGRAHPLTLESPKSIQEADYLLIESTYGDRLHPARTALEALGEIVADTFARKGHLLIPSFAVGRTQDVLYILSQLKAESAIPEIPVFLDSPLGINATEVFSDHPNWHRLSPGDVQAMHKMTTLIKSQQQSRDLLNHRGSSIVIAGSGMVSGGRILQHLERRLSDDRNTVLLVGYQAAGTRGRLLQEGASELKMFGGYVPVRAKIRHFQGLSAHADQQEILSWLQGFTATPPRQTFIVHGEPQAADALRVKIQDVLKWPCSVAKHDSQTTLD